MKQLRSYGDERTLAFCAYCGGETGTRDHCPSRVFLDEPYPDNLPIVPACSSCNAGFSADEEYFACLLSCVLAGSTDPDSMPRDKIRRILKVKPALRARIEKGRSISGEAIIFSPEHDRVSSVISKLARGHALYELHESFVRPPDKIHYLPMSLMETAQRKAFENPEMIDVWPEVGSRAMQRLIQGTDLAPGGWIDVQLGRYRFHASISHGIEVQIVFQEYLACYAQWRD